MKIESCEENPTKLVHELSDELSPEIFGHPTEMLIDDHALDHVHEGQRIREGRQYKRIELFTLGLPKSASLLHPLMLGAASPRASGKRSRSEERSNPPSPPLSVFG